MEELMPIDKRFNCSQRLGENSIHAEQIGRSNKTNISVWIHCETGIKDDFYLKVFNDIDFMKATKCARIKIFRAMYKSRPTDDFMESFFLTEAQIISMIEILKSKSVENYQSMWTYLIDSFFRFSNDKKIKRRLKKAINRMPDYEKLQRDRRFCDQHTGTKEYLKC